MLSGSKIFTLIPLDKHSDGALGTLWIKVSKDYAWTLQMKSFGPQKCKFHAFWQFFRNQLIDWIGHVLLVQHSKTTHTIFFRFYTLIFIGFFEYELTEVVPGLLIIQIQILAVWNVTTKIVVAN